MLGAGGGVRGSSERSRPQSRRLEDEGGGAGGGRVGRRGQAAGPGRRAGRRFPAAPGLRWARIFEGRRLLLPGSAGRRSWAGQRSCHGAAGLAGHRPGGRALPAPVPAGLLLPGPGGGDGAGAAEAIGKGLSTFIAMLLTERLVAVRSVGRW